MSNTIKSFLIFIIVICIQLAVYAVFLQPLIFSWGASDSEAKMSMIGDNLAPFISSTRAISIDAPISDVWKWLIQLGADRGGFYSYDSIEKPLGYEFRNQEKIVPEFHDMKVGRIVPGSLDESKSKIKYNWPVVAVEPGKSFVLKGWGAFLLKKISPEKTRLIIRTHGRELSDLKSSLGYFFMMPLHHIMERRMLMGIKARSEAGAGVRLSSTSDILWFLGVLLSGVGIAFMVFMGRGIKSGLLSAFVGIIWLWPLLILDPQPVYSMTLLLVVVVMAAWLIINGRQNPNDRLNTAALQPHKMNED